MRNLGGLASNSCALMVPFQGGASDADVVTRLFWRDTVGTARLRLPRTSANTVSKAPRKLQEASRSPETQFPKSNELNSPRVKAGYGT